MKIQAHYEIVLSSGNVQQLHGYDDIDPDNVRGMSDEEILESLKVSFAANTNPNFVMKTSTPAPALKVTPWKKISLLSIIIKRTE